MLHGANGEWSNCMDEQLVLRLVRDVRVVLEAPSPEGGLPARVPAFQGLPEGPCGKALIAGSPAGPPSFTSVFLANGMGEWMG
jgi:hypothetical protein